MATRLPTEFGGPTRPASPIVFRNLQALRGLAALLVVFVHLDEVLPRVGLPAFGGAGVDIFFVISGFIMVYITADRDVTPWSFMADRIARIVPIYWAVTCALFGVALVAPGLLESTRADWSDLIKSLAFIPFVKANGLTAPVLYVGWTLNYEMFFYLLFAIGLVVAKPRGGAIAVICALTCLVGAGGFFDQIRNIVFRFYTSPFIIDFVLGAVLGLAYPRVPSRARMLAKFAAAVTVLAAFMAAVSLPVFFPQSPEFVACGLPACLIVGGALALERWGWMVKTGWSLVLGNASYSIYLTQPFVTDVAQKAATKLQPAASGSLVLIIGTLAAVCVVGILVHRMVERPLSALARQLLKAQRPKPGPDRRGAVAAMPIGSQFKP